MTTRLTQEHGQMHSLTYSMQPFGGSQPTAIERIIYNSATCAYSSSLSTSGTQLLIPVLFKIRFFF